MMRRPLALGLCAGLLAVSAAANAEDLPLRKTGLWEMKIVKVGGSVPEMTMQHCTDPTIDREMNNAVSPIARQICAKQDIRKTASGYVVDSVCSFAGISTTTHADIAGDFNSAYTVISTAHSDKGINGKPLDATTRIEAKWIGDCKPGQKPGDIVMPAASRWTSRTPRS